MARTGWTSLGIIYLAVGASSGASPASASPASASPASASPASASPAGASPASASLGSASPASASPASVSPEDGPFHDKPASPRSLPGDNLPPFGMLDTAGNLGPVPPLPPGALHRGPGSPPESTAPGPSLSRSMAAALAAVDACKAAGFRVGATVIDSSGEARAMLTADGSDGSHVFVAMRKALAALAFRTASSKAAQSVRNDSRLLAEVTPNMFVEGGALPILINGSVIGAIGVSGAGGTPIGHQDEICAAAGLRRLSDKTDAAINSPNPRDHH